MNQSGSKAAVHLRPRRRIASAQYAKRLTQEEEEEAVDVADADANANTNATANATANAAHCRCADDRFFLDALSGGTDWYLDRTRTAIGGSSVRESNRIEQKHTLAYM